MEEASVDQEADVNTMSMRSYTTSTSWEIACGSLSDTLTFDSSAAPTADADDDEFLSFPKSPLILRPSSFHSPPCEITITFAAAQQHQVRQVYVRSTARVYEIYYAPNIQSNNEYLCTVRCGVAIRDEQVLQSNCTLADLKVADEVLDEKNGKRSCSSSTNEDGWVDVKTPDSSSPPDNGNYSSAGNMQDLYEATAEIADANPCMSITVRLLSLQNKCCVFVDEIYVFADMVDSNASENKPDQAGETSPSPGMAMHMLFPALLQLSKARGLPQIQNGQVLDTEKEKTERTLSKTAEQNSSPCKNEKEETSCSNKQCDIGLAVPGCMELNQNEFPLEVSDEIRKPATSCDYTERLLDQLVSRITRLEDLLLRFEDNMLKPISSIDSRLQHVEQQVEELSRKSKNLNMKTCKGYSAPEFSCHNSDHCPLFNINNECPKSDLSASTEKDFTSSAADESVHMAIATESFPALMVKVPEFPDDDDEDDLLATDSSVREPKVLIDDALASALAGFMSSSLNEPRRYTRALVVKAPDFPSEDDGSASAQIALMHSESGISFKLLDSDDGTDSLNHEKDLASSSSSFSIEKAPVEVRHSGNDILDLSGTAEEPAEKCLQTLHSREGTVTNNRVLPAGVDHDTAKTDFPQLTDACQLSVVLDEADIMNQFLKNQTLGIADTTHESEAVVKKSEPKQKVGGEVSSENIMQDVLGLSCSFSRMDFRTLILDVKFDSLDKTQPGSPLEFLLGEIPISDDNEHDGGVSDDGRIVDQGDPILVTAEEGESGRKLSADLDCYSLNSVASRSESEKQDKFEGEACRRVEGPSSSLI